MLLEYKKDLLPGIILTDISHEEGVDMFAPIATVLSRYVESGFSKDKRKILELYCNAAGITEDLPRFLKGLLLTWASKDTYGSGLPEDLEMILLRGMSYLEKMGVDIGLDERKIDTVLTKYFTERFHPLSKIPVLEAIFNKAKFIKHWFVRQRIVTVERFEQYLFKYEAMISFRFAHFYIERESGFSPELVEHIVMFYILGDKSDRQDFHRAYCHKIARFVCSENVSHKAIDRMKALDFNKQELGMDVEAACAEGP
jgi:hypothetical protein